MSKHMDNSRLILASNYDRRPDPVCQIIKYWLHCLSGDHRELVSNRMIQEAADETAHLTRLHRESMIRIGSRNRRRTLDHVQPIHLSFVAIDATLRRIVARVTQRSGHG